MSTIYKDLENTSDGALADVCRGVANRLTPARYYNLRALLRECADRLEDNHLENLMPDDLYQDDDIGIGGSR